MTTIFMVCAALGGTILVCQLVMALVGMGGHMLGDLSTDVGHDLGGGLHGGGFHDGDGLHTDHDGGDLGQNDQAVHHDSTWWFGIISFRTVVAALTFFGLAGMTACESHASAPMALLIAVAAGAAAMFAVYRIMQFLYRLQADGNVRIQRSVGQHGDIYLRVPGERSGVGKIQFSLQNRTMEYLAVTDGPELPTGAKVVVVSVVNPTTLQVQAE